MKYLVCRNGKRITVKRSDWNNDFGEVLDEADTFLSAKELARTWRRKPSGPVKSVDDLFPNTFGKKKEGEM